MKVEQRECSETLELKIQTPGNYPEETIQHAEHGESLKSKAFPVIVNSVKVLSFISTVFISMQMFRSIPYITVFCIFYECN